MYFFSELIEQCFLFNYHAFVLHVIILLHVTKYYFSTTIAILYLRFIHRHLKLNEEY